MTENLVALARAMVMAEVTRGEVAELVRELGDEKQAALQECMFSKSAPNSRKHKENLTRYNTVSKRHRNALENWKVLSHNADVAHAAYIAALDNQA
jgi:hypothetical protein